MHNPKILNETLVLFADAAKLPGRPARRTLYKWKSRGRGGVTLEWAMWGGRLCTSLEAFKRFLERINQ